MKIIQTMAFLALTISSIATVNAATIDNINTIDNNTIELSLNDNIIFSDISVNGDIKVLKDIPVGFSAKDSENTKKIALNLGDDLTANTSYSLITILGSEGNIDFNIGDYISGEIINSDSPSSGIEKINILDSRTIEVYFTDDLTEDTFEFKILSEINTLNLKSEGNNKVMVDTSVSLEASKDYIIMVLSLEDVNDNLITLDEDLYDFTTPSVLKEDIKVEEKTIATTPKVEEKAEEGNVEEVALNSASTPETGTATSILIFFTLILNGLFFFRKKFSK